MQTYPTVVDYIGALQNPAASFTEPDLKQSRVAQVDRFGVPRPASGNFAAVFQMENGTQRFALRCFTRAADHQQVRYHALSQHLRTLRLSSLVGFQYLPDAIRVKGKPYPILKMEWVPGRQLHRFVEAHLKQPQVLEQLAGHWLSVTSDLQRHDTAHGDVQHGNILVSDRGEIKLVDYDSMYVPALRHQPAEEVGHPNYQHPARARTAYYGERLDNFPGLVLYLSLLALAKDPSLWAPFHKGENLIFQEQDFARPLGTPLWQKLQAYPDNRLRTLTHHLAQLCQYKVDQLPSLAEIISTPSRATVHPSASTPWWTQAPSAAAYNSQPTSAQSQVGVTPPSQGKVLLPPTADPSTPTRGVSTVWYQQPQPSAPVQPSVASNAPTPPSKASSQTKEEELSTAAVWGILLMLAVICFVIYKLAGG